MDEESWTWIRGCQKPRDAPKPTCRCEEAFVADEAISLLEQGITLFGIVLLLDF